MARTVQLGLLLATAACARTEVVVASGDVEPGPGDPSGGDAAGDAAGLALFVVSKECPYHTADVALIAILEASHHSHMCVLPTEVDSAISESHDVVLISGTVISDDIAGVLTGYSGGVVTLEAFVWDDWGWSSDEPEWRGPTTTMTVLTSTHPIIANLGAGAVTLYESPDELAGAASVAGGAVVLGEDTGDGVLLALEAGAPLIAGFTTGRRVGFGLKTATYDILSPKAVDVIDRSLRWAAGEL